MPFPVFHIISAYIRLGHKYHIEHLLKESLDFLLHHFTDNFDTWLAHADYVPKSFLRIHAIGVVNLARLVDCDVILPTALMVCGMLPAQDLVRGFDREDGTREKLSEGDLVRCLEGRTRLMQERTRTIITLFTACEVDFANDHCSECTGWMHSILMDHGMNPGTVASPDVLVKWDPHAIGDESYDEICEECKAVLQWGYHKGS